MCLWTLNQQWALDTRLLTDLVQHSPFFLCQGTYTGTCNPWDYSSWVCPAHCFGRRRKMLPKLQAGLWTHVQMLHSSQKAHQILWWGRDLQKWEKTGIHSFWGNFQKKPWSYVLPEALVVKTIPWEYVVNAQHHHPRKFLVWLHDYFQFETDMHTHTFILV